MKSRLMAVLAAVAVCVICVEAQAQDSRAKAREVVKNNVEAVVWVSAVVKVEITGGGRTLGSPEDKVQALGTVIDPSGLVVVSLSAIDPGTSIQGRKMNAGGESITLTATSTHSQVKIEIGEKEIPAKIVLKDTELDLAFIVPEKADEKLGVKALKLEKAPKLELLDEMICLARMVKALDSGPAAAMSEVSGVITRPRTLYMGGKTAGGPVLAPDGTVIGITVSYKTDPSKPESATLVILPAEEVAEVAKQALAKRNEPSSEPATATSKPASAASVPAK